MVAFTSHISTVAHNMLNTVVTCTKYCDVKYILLNPDSSEMLQKYIIIIVITSVGRQQTSFYCCILLQQ